MTEPARWEPDHQMIAAFLADPRPRKDLKLSPADRAWVVAGLTLADLDADDIATRIGVCMRLVRTIRAEPMTQICMFYQREVETFTNEMRMVSGELQAMALQLNTTEAELTRTRRQLANLIGRTEFKCGHKMDYGNTYENPKTGKKFCRTCHADRERNKRASNSQKG